MQAEEKLKATFAECLGLPLDAVTDDLCYNSIHQWDSVAHMALISSIEQAFDILIETDDVIDMTSFAKAKEIVSKYEVRA